jgi:hypothetical protein
LYLFPPASSQGPLLLFWDGFALFTPKYVHLQETERVSFLSGMTAAWSFRTIVLFLEIAPKDEPDLWRSTFFSEFWPDFF